jgi:hypothetical protein
MSSIRAADPILNHTTKAIKIEDIEARVAELEHSGSSEADAITVEWSC